MTEKEWLAFTDPTPMLAFLYGRVSDRKLRLFACACCSRLVCMYTRYRQAVEHYIEDTERRIDGQPLRKDCSSMDMYDVFSRTEPLASRWKNSQDALQLLG